MLICCSTSKGRTRASSSGGSNCPRTLPTWASGSIQQTTEKTETSLKNFRNTSRDFRRSFPSPSVAGRHKNLVGKCQRRFLSQRWATIGEDRKAVKELATLVSKELIRSHLSDDFSKKISILEVWETKMGQTDKLDLVSYYSKLRAFPFCVPGVMSP